MEQRIKKYLLGVIQENTKSDMSFGGSDILLLQDIAPIEFCCVLLVIKQRFKLSFNDATILGHELETVDAICEYIIRHHMIVDNEFFSSIPKGC